MASEIQIYWIIFTNVKFRVAEKPLVLLSILFSTTNLISLIKTYEA